jgi:hypothetical protein
VRQFVADQVGFVRDGRHAVCRAILFGGEGSRRISIALPERRTAWNFFRSKSSPVALRGNPGCRRRTEVVGDGFVNRLDVNLDGEGGPVGDDGVGFVVGQAFLGQRNAEEIEQKQEIDRSSLHFCTGFYQKESLFQLPDSELHSRNVRFSAMLLYYPLLCIF